MSKHERSEKMIQKTSQLENYLFEVSYHPWWVNYHLALGICPLSIALFRTLLRRGMGKLGWTILFPINNNNLGLALRTHPEMDKLGNTSPEAWEIARGCPPHRAHSQYACMWYVCGMGVACGMSVYQTQFGISDWHSSGKGQAAEWTLITIAALAIIPVMKRTCI